MSKSLDDLSPTFRLKVQELLIILEQKHGMHLTIIDTLRTSSEQADNVRRGVSWTIHSKHLADKDGKSNAIDVAPTMLLREKNWAPQSPLWQVIGFEAKKLGLKWGGDWKQKDMCHIEV